EKPNSRPSPVAPTTSWAPATGPDPKLKDLYMGRSATMARSDVTRGDTPAMSSPMPQLPPTPGVQLGFALRSPLNTSTVVRLFGGSVSDFNGLVLGKSVRYCRWACAAVAFGFCTVRYSLNPRSVVPSAKSHSVPGFVAPNATCPSRMGPSPKLKLFT